MSSTSHLLVILIIAIPVVIHILHRNMDIDGCTLVFVYLKFKLDILHIHIYFSRVEQ